MIERSRVLFAIVAVTITALATKHANAQSSGTQQQQSATTGSPKTPSNSEDRPYDQQLFRLAEILGALHYLREICGANEGPLWRDQMRELVSSEGTNALRRARFVEAFNRGYRDYSRTYRGCTQPALLTIQRFIEQGTSITDTLAESDK